MASSKQLHIDAIQSIMPSKIISPGKSRRINLTNTTLTRKLLQSRLRMVFYYNKSSEEESAWTAAAWVKESMSVALADWPELAGRLRKDREGEGCWEIKINDAGLRLVQASIEMRLDEFIAAEDRTDKEAALADWRDIDMKNPDFCALCYIQGQPATQLIIDLNDEGESLSSEKTEDFSLSRAEPYLFRCLFLMHRVTQFEGNGYAVGFSLSLLLNDPLFLVRFLKSWTEIHMQMLADGRLSKSPMFHLNYFQSPSHPKHLRSIPIDSFSSTEATTTVLFKAPRMQSDGINNYKKLAYEALKSPGVKGVTKFTILVNKSDGLEIESCDIDTLKMEEINGDVNGAVKLARWEELGLENFTLTKGNKPVLVSYRFVSSEVDEALVAVMQLINQDNDGTEMFIGAAIPKL